MTISESEWTSWFHSEIFQQVPLNIAVIDRDYNIVEANKNFREYFGDWQGRKCYSAYKKADTPCANCRAQDTFRDGTSCVYQDKGKDVHGNHTYYVVDTMPVVDKQGNISHIVEMSRNITDWQYLQREYQILFERVPCYIAVLDRNLRIVRANEKLREIFGECRGKFCYEVYKKREERCEDCPALVSFREGKECSSSHVGIARDGSETHYIVATSPLFKEGNDSDYVVEILTDITHVKLLEKEKLEAERLAAVGETVAGLAHTIKNILMGLEGGMYMMSSGFKKDNKTRISEGWEVLQRNMEKVTSLVRAFLSFAKGRKPQLVQLDLNVLVDDIVDLYAQTAKKLGVSLVRGERHALERAPIDQEALHTCLTNLVSNAIDACQASAKADCRVVVDVREENGIIMFEVCDSGQGMEYEIKKKLFTTFFTTKGGQGTGLGLLTTRKIVQEHGGKIFVESTPSEGTMFRIELPRARLIDIANSRP